jgi:ethanolamine utilization protein EutP (predicted NTPase)
LLHVVRFLSVFVVTLVVFHQAGQMDGRGAFSDQDDLFVTLEAKVKRDLDVILGVEVTNDELELLAKQLHASLVFGF